MVSSKILNTKRINYKVKDFVLKQETNKYQRTCLCVQHGKAHVKLGKYLIRHNDGITKLLLKYLFKQTIEKIINITIRWHK